MKEIILLSLINFVTIFPSNTSFAEDPAPPKTIDKTIELMVASGQNKCLTPSMCPEASYQIELDKTVIPYQEKLILKLSMASLECMTGPLKISHIDQSIESTRDRSQTTTMKLYAKTQVAPPSDSCEGAAARPLELAVPQFFGEATVKLLQINGKKLVVQYSAVLEGKDCHKENPSENKGCVWKIQQLKILKDQV